MKLKKVHDRDTLKDPLPKVQYVEVQHLSKVWKPSTRVVETGLAEGWLSMSDGNLVMKTPPDEDDITFKILAPPGYYCCHSGKPLQGQEAARRHIAANYKDKKSPDPSNPAGYARHNFYFVEQVNG